MMFISVFISDQVPVQIQMMVTRAEHIDTPIRFATRDERFVPPRLDLIPLHLGAGIFLVHEVVRNDDIIVAGSHWAANTNAGYGALLGR